MPGTLFHSPGSHRWGWDLIISRNLAEALLAQMQLPRQPVNLPASITSFVYCKCVCVMMCYSCVCQYKLQCKTVCAIFIHVRKVYIFLHCHPPILQLCCSQVIVKKGSICSTRINIVNRDNQHWLMPALIRLTSACSQWMLWNDVSAPP